jgi:hypothetical protein
MFDYQSFKGQSHVIVGFVYVHYIYNIYIYILLYYNIIYMLCIVMSHQTPLYPIFLLDIATTIDGDISHHF